MTIKSDYDKEFEIWKEKELKPMLEKLAEEAKKENRYFDLKSREKFEIQKRLEARFPSEKYNNKEEVAKEYMIFHCICLFLFLVSAVAWYFHITKYYDIIYIIIHVIFVIIFTAVVYIVGASINGFEHDKEREFEIDVRLTEESKKNSMLEQDLYELNRYESRKDPKRWQDFLKKTNQLKKIIDQIKSTWDE